MIKWLQQDWAYKIVLACELGYLVAILCGVHA